MDPQLRVSDADREHVVALLRQHVGEGRLSLDVFSERCARAYAARTAGDLAALTSDLPPEGKTMPVSATEHRAVAGARWRWGAVALAGFAVAALTMSGFGQVAAAAGSMMGGMCP